MKPLINPTVSAVFDSYPDLAQKRLLFIRELIYQTAAETDGVGPIQETLKWSEPAYLTSQSRSGSTIRIGWKASSPEQYAIYFNCHTTLIATFREIYPDTFKYEGNRAIVFNLNDDIPSSALCHCISLGLSNHHRKHLHLLGE